MKISRDFWPAYDYREDFFVRMYEDEGYSSWRARVLAQRLKRGLKSMHMKELRLWRNVRAHEVSLEVLHLGIW